MSNPSLFVSIELIKNRSKVIGELLKKEFGIDVKHGQCLKLVSQLFGFPNWNTANALIKTEVANMEERGREAVDEIMSDPIESLRFIRDRDVHLTESDPEYAKDVKTAAHFFSKRKSEKGVYIKTIGDLRKATAHFDDSDFIGAHYIHQLREITNEVDEDSSPDDELGYEFRFKLTETDSVGFKPRTVTFEMVVENAYMNTAR
ncbi:MAG: hypothetical protein EOP09_00275 [Proteobacteria bacterium]|nr:MAG: hypothetical protein EOP09_00275 [Pseudomonadota bacterium]